MMSKLILFSVTLTLCVGGLAGAVLRRAKENARVPVLLELFTSEGCSSCPPADQLLAVLDEKRPAPGAELIVLSEHVDYWDRLGWKDRFSSLQYSSRQEEYASKYHLDGVYTPQLVVDGRFGFVGSDQRVVLSAIQKTAQQPKVSVVISNTRCEEDRVTADIEIPAAESPIDGRAVLFAAIADNRAQSQVTRGENGGRTLAHVAVARVLERIGIIDLKLPNSKDVKLSLLAGTGANGLRLIVFMQNPISEHIVAAAAHGVTQ
jgi:hypothetical protein